MPTSSKPAEVEERGITPKQIAGFLTVAFMAVSLIVGGVVYAVTTRSDVNRKVDREEFTPLKQQVETNSKEIAGVKSVNESQDRVQTEILRKLDVLIERTDDLKKKLDNK